MAELLQAISSNIHSLKTSQYFVNAAPFSGKSSLLSNLGSQLAHRIVGLTVFGPLQFRLEDDCLYTQALVQSFYDDHYLDEMPKESFQNIAAMWDWLTQNLAAKNRRFVILLDMESAIYADTERAGSLFSALRGLKTTEHERNFSVHHIVIGYWNHQKLEKHYEKTILSFPYTLEENYSFWAGLQTKDILDALPQQWGLRDLYADILLELTGGHAGLLFEILGELANKNFELNEILLLIKRLAIAGQTATRLMTAWKELPPPALRLVQDLLLHRFLPLQLGINPYEELLINSGIAKKKILGDAAYLQFQSWYVELLLRAHLETLGLSNDELTKLQFSEIVPEIQSLNREAYRLIFDIENKARNLVIKILSAQQGNDAKLLQGFVTVDRGMRLSLDQVAMEKRQKSKLAKGLNPLIAYLTTGQLTDLLEAMGSQYRLRTLHTIADLMKEVTQIRNAVMHNQLIDEKDLLRLYHLQGAIYKAF